MLCVTPQDHALVVYNSIIPQLAPICYTSLSLIRSESSNSRIVMVVDYIYGFDAIMNSDV